MKDSFDDLLQYLTFLNVYVRHTKSQLDILDSYNAVEWKNSSPYAFVEIETGDPTIYNGDEPEIEELKNNPLYIGGQLNEKYHYEIKQDKINGLVSLYLENSFDDITTTLKDKTDKFINDFDNSFLQSTENSQQTTIKYIKQRLQNKLKQETRLFKYYPTCKEYIRGIENHLKRTWDIDLDLNYDIDYIEHTGNIEANGLSFPPPIWSDYVYDFKKEYGEDTLKFNIDKAEFKVEDNKTEEKTLTNSNLFRLKTDVNPKVFRSIYCIFMDSDILDIEVDEESFVEALTKSETDAIIKFDCSTSLAVSLLDEIKVLFKNFTDTAIGNSNVFYTKDNTKLKAGYIYKARNEFKEKHNESDIIKLNKLKRELKPIISSAIK